MILAILQARMGSSRLPGKVLKPLLGRPMLLRQIERVRQSRRIDKLCIATTIEPGDDTLEDLCRQEGIDCFRGSENDVLDRFYQAARSRSPQSVVRLTADCPLIDPQVIDEVVDCHTAGNFDYTSNIEPPTFPDGLDVEVLTSSTLRRTWTEARLPSEREHVTPYIRKHPALFRQGIIRAVEDLSRYRWTVDQEEDFRLVTAIFEELFPKNPSFSYREVLHWLKEHPEVTALNAGISRNEGLGRSMARDHDLQPRIP